MRLSTLTTVLALGVAIAPLARAQTSTAALPFHAGQWGGQFAVGSNVQGLGLVRFHSPSAAWVFDASASLNHFTADAGFGNENTSTSQSLSLRVGPRGYAPVASQVVRYLGAGLLGGLTHTESTSGGTSTSSKAWMAGAYAELGGDYLVTPHLAIGVQGTVQAVYSRASNSAQPTANAWSFSLGATRLVATIFF